MHTRVKTTEFIAFCCISWVFLLILCTLPNIATPSALCRSASLRPRWHSHVFWSNCNQICVYLIWRLFLDFSLFFPHFLYSETVSCNYGTCSWGVFMLCTLISDTDWCTFLIKWKLKSLTKCHIDVGVIFNVVTLYNSLIAMLTKPILHYCFLFCLIIVCLCC